MVYLIGGVVLLVVLLLAGRAFVNANPVTVVRWLMWIGVFAALAVALLLIESGRFLPVVFALGGAAPFFIRARTVWRRWMAGGQSSPSGRVSEVETEYLRMSLDHESGTMTGVVRKGREQGHRLEELDLPRLLALWREVRAEDPASANLLEGYLDRFQADWRDAAEAAGGGEARPSAGMTVEEAYSILGLKAGASPAEIKDAHRRLMMKLHPDQGGSDVLAAQVNRAKDLLLGK
jgi:hypothetical protein